MQLNWLESNIDTDPEGVLSESATHVLHLASCEAIDEALIKQAVIETAHKAAVLLEDNIVDDSLYLMFIWQPEQATLNVLVTDDKKANDAKHVVRCVLANANKLELAEDDSFADLLSFWIRDYLTTCSEYMCFSMVAIFTSSTRDQTNML